MARQIYMSFLIQTILSVPESHRIVRRRTRRCRLADCTAGWELCAGFSGHTHPAPKTVFAI